MKKLGIFLAIMAILASCKKDKQEGATGTVIQKGGYTTSSYIVVIDNPSASKYSFICSNGMLSSMSYNCGNAVFIVNLPANLQTIGKKIKFNRWSDKGPNMVSSATFVPHDLEVYDAVEIP